MFSKQLFEAIEMPPDGFLEGSVYKDSVFIGSKKKIKLGFSLHPEGGHEYGIYVSPVSRYARMYGSNLAEAFVNIKKPFIVEGKYEISQTDLTKNDVNGLKKKGYDSIVVTNSTLNKANEFVLFDSKQIWVFNAR
jgi:hypothetical protein